MSASPQTADKAPDLLAAALAYAERGWYVVPMKPGDKEPAATLVPHGFKDATKDAAQIRKWWERVPDANVALALEASGLADIDLDVGHHPGQDGIREAEALGWKTDGPLIRTASGGLAALYRLPSNGARPRRAWNPRRPDDKGALPDGIEVRWKSCRVVPPSRTPAGRYTWESGPDGPLPDLPGWALASEAEAPPGQALAVGGVIPKGQRHNYMVRLAGNMRRAGATAAEIEAALAAVNARCEEPLPAAELHSIAVGIGQKDAPAEAYARPELRVLADVTPEALTWLWPGRVPLGKLTLLAGDPGLGKSTLALDVAARDTSGTPWPDATDTTRRKPGSVLLLSAEDDAADTIRPRAEAAGADLSKIVLLEAVRVHDEKGTESTRAFNLVKDVERLDAALDTMDNPNLVIIDPLSAYLGKTESNNNAEVRATLAPLQVLAQRRRVAVLGITHMRKSAGRSVYRTMGSLAFVAAARAVWGVGTDDEDETGTRRLLLPVKCNLSRDNTGMAYSIVGQAVDGLGELPRVQWEKTPIAQPDVERHLSGEQDQHDTGGQAIREAVMFLRLALADGPMLATQIMEMASAQGIAEKTLRNAKKRMHVGSRRPGPSTGPWEWYLAEEVRV